MPTRAEIVAAGRAYLGVRWRHMGRDTNGIDCIGLVIAVGRAIGLDPVDARYDRFARDASLHDHLTAQLVRVHRGPLPGDVGLFADTIHPYHVAIFTPGPCPGVASDRLHLLHASAPRRKVVEEPYAFAWPGQLRGLFAFPGVGA